MIVAGVWLGWQVVQTALTMRAPPALALRIAPTSPEAMRRSAEASLTAGKNDEARLLAEQSLIEAPFNARALRVLGLVEARDGHTDAADELLTLAGNWSLRDDPAHAWLVENRLRRGDYRSAFGHADTLARRREDLYPQVFGLFAAAGIADPRSLPVLAEFISRQPPWRDDFLQYLHNRPDRLGVLANLAVLLERSRSPLTGEELAFLYRDLIGSGQFAAVTEIRRRTNRPSSNAQLQDGDFSDGDADRVLPFGWRLLDTAGATSTVIADDLTPGNRALRVEYNGFAQGHFVEQMTMLATGRQILRGRWRSETLRDDMRVRWTMTCAQTGAPVTTDPADELHAENTSWSSFRVTFIIPPDCPAQWLKLSPQPGDRRTSIAVWFDDLQIGPERASGTR